MTFRQRLCGLLGHRRVRTGFLRIDGQLIDVGYCGRCEAGL